MNETWHVYAWRRGAAGRRIWVPLAWADDLEVGRTLFLQACASTSSPVRLIHDDGSASVDPGFDRSVIAERILR